MKEHKTGYYVWIYAEKFWHKTLEGAKKQAVKAQEFCPGVEIVDAATGQLVAWDMAKGDAGVKRNP